MLKGIFIILTIIVLIGFPRIGHSQQGNFYQQDLTTINVDELSDSQIIQMIRRAEESGMTQQQMESAALARGMRPSEIQKLRVRIERIQQRGDLKVSDQVYGRTRQPQELQSREQREALLREREKAFGPKPVPYEEDDIFSTLVIVEEDEQTKIERKLFGYSFFNTDALTFEPSYSIATPKNYQVGPGDEILIDIWGASQENYRLEISPEGNIIIPGVGPIQISGLTIDELSKRLTDRLKSIYSGLGGVRPNTFAQVSIGNVRSIKVSIIGEVRFPGTYTVSSLSSVFNALYLSGGPSINGSFREIRILRDNEIASVLDIYDFLIHGEQGANIRLQDQDIIHVGPYKTRIEVEGEVKRPALFEIAPGETLNDAILFAGGFSEKAYTHRLKVLRSTTREKRIIDVSIDDFDQFSLQNGDLITVEPILDRFENRVEISGAVYRSGNFSLSDGMTLTDLINKAEGIRGDAFQARAAIYRTKADYTLEVIPVNLTDVLNGHAPDVELKREDLINVPSVFDLQEEYNIEILGEIKQPGIYPFMHNLTLEDIIVLAGGMLESASQSRVEVARRVRDYVSEARSNTVAEVHTFNICRHLTLSDSASTFTLMPFDLVFVRKSPGYEVQQIVNVEGEVFYPGQYSISDKEERISDLITRAGGLSDEAYIAGARLIRKVPVDEAFRKRMLETIEMQTGDTLLQLQLTDREQAIGIDLERILANPGSKFDLILEEGDILKIPKQLQTVRLSGALLYPVTVRYDRRHSFRNYVAQAGGFADNAKRRKSYVIYPNGSVDRTHNLLVFNKYPSIEPGSEIIVPQKREREGLSPQALISMGTAMSSMALVIVTLINRL